MIYNYQWRSSDIFSDREEPRCHPDGIRLKLRKLIDFEKIILENESQVIFIEDLVLFWYNRYFFYYRTIMSWNMSGNNWWVSIFLLFLIKPLPSQFMVNYEWDKRQQTMAPTSDHLRPPAANNKIFCFASHLTPFYNYYHQSNNLTDCSHSDKDFFSLTQLTTFSLSVRNY